MTNTIWTNPVSSDWSDAGNWSAGVPTIATTAVINASGLYTVAISSADAANSLFVDAAGATLSEDSGGSLSLKRGLTLDSGTVSLNGANSFGGTTQLVGGTLELGNTAALGNSNLVIDGGTLVGTANENLSNVVKTGGSFTMAAADGDTVRLTGNTVIDMNSGGFINFGQSGDDGVVVWAPVTFGLDNNGNAGFDVNVNAGTLRDGNGSLGEVLGAATSVEIAAKATVDIHGHADAIGHISGGGIISSTANGGSLTLGQGTFSGDIEGGLALTVTGQLSLTGVNTYNGNTTVNDGAILDLTDVGSIKDNVTLLNGATLNLLGSIGGRITIEKGAILNWLDNGSIGGNIADNGILNLQFSGPAPVTIQGNISGSGSIFLETGTVSLDGSNTYKGVVTLAGGVLEIGSGNSLGTGELLLSGGTLMGTATESLGNPIAINGESTIVAASGTTLTLDADDNWSMRSGVEFGDSVNDGVIVWDMPTGSAVGKALKSIEIVSGTLRAGNSNFQSLLDIGATHHGSTAILSGATLDVAGFTETIYNVGGNGTIANSGAPTVVTLSGGGFFGDFSGPITLDVSGKTALDGDAANWDTINLLTGAQLNIGSSSANIVFPTGSYAILTLGVPTQFTGSVSGFSPGCEMIFPTVYGTRSAHFTVSCSGDAVGGTLTMTGPYNSVTIAMNGDYTGGTFDVSEFATHGNPTPFVYFVPNASAASAAASSDAFNFSAAPGAHTATEANVMHMHGGHPGSEIALSHDVAEAMHAHGFALDHFTHDLFVHHAVPEALA